MVTRGLGAPYEGYLDDCDCMRVSGWCYRSDRPDEPLTVVVRELGSNGAGGEGGREIGRVTANRFRRDLLAAGKGNGRHGFHLDLPADLVARSETCRVSVTVDGTGGDLLGSPGVVRRKVGELILSPPVFSRFLDGPPLDFGTLRIDISNTCNLKCVYCPTIAVRTKERVSLSAFEELLDRRVHGLENLALGCGQEPTTSSQLCDYIEAVGRSRVRPTGMFMLVTNGTLLHKHDWERIGKSTLNALYLSLDSMDQETLGALRCGSKVDRITENVGGLLEAAPNVRLHINVVVTTRNVDGIDDVIAWGKEQDCATFTLREMYLPPTPSTEEAALQPLVLPEGRFARLEAHLRDRWPGEAFQFANRQHLEEEYDDWAPRLL